MVSGMEPAAGMYSNVTSEELSPHVDYTFRLYAVEGAGDVLTPPTSDGEFLLPADMPGEWVGGM